MRRWTSPFAVAREGAQTGDGRIWDDGAFYWEAQENGQLGALRWDREDDGAHLGAVVVGTIDRIERREGGAIWASGILDDESEIGAEVARMMDHDPPLLGGVSIDGDDDAVVVIDTTMTEADLVAAEEEMMGLLAAAGDPLPENADDAVILFMGESGDIIERHLRTRIRAVTLVDIPAFADAFITLDPVGAEDGMDGEPVDEPEEGMALTAAVIGSTDLPIAARDTEWDGSGATTRVFELCTDEDTVDVECVSRAFVLRRDDADPQTQAAYSLGFADVINGQLQIVPAGVAATAGGRGLSAVEGISADERSRAESRICALYDAVRAKFDDWPECPFDRNDEAAEAMAAAGASVARGFLATLRQRGGARVTTAASGCTCGGTCGQCSHESPTAVVASAPAIPAEWFEQPDLNQPTPITVTDDGRVFGHVARHDTCHTGLPGCVTAPFSARGYADFHRYAETASGIRLPVAAGRITGGHGEYSDVCSCCRGNDDHACRYLSLQAAIGFHDQLSTLAYVRAGEDQANNAIWVAGIVAPEAAERDRTLLSRRMVSGDWRHIAGQPELVEILSLAKEKPGFPVALVASGNRVMALTGAGMILPTPTAEMDVVPALTADLAADIARQAALGVVTEMEDRQKAVAARERIETSARAYQARRVQKAG